MTDIIKLSINDIPLWLQNSELYNNLKENDNSNDEFTISLSYFRENSQVSDLYEFKEVLKISSFWLINNPPDGLIYFIENFSGFYEEFKKECKNEFSMFSEWWDIFDIIYTFDKTDFISKFIEIENITMIEYYRSSDNPITFQHCIQASGVSESMLNYCLTLINNPEEECFYIKCFMNALFKNKLECVKYLLSIRPSIKTSEEDFCTKASQGGSLECLKYLHENGFPWGKDTILCAGWKGYLNCLEYLVSNGCPFDDEVLYCCTSKCYDYLQTVIEMYDELSDSEDHLSY